MDFDMDEGSLSQWDIPPINIANGYIPSERLFRLERLTRICEDVENNQAIQFAIDRFSKKLSNEIS